MGIVTMNVKIEGLKELHEAFRAAPALSVNEISTAVKKSLITIQSQSLKEAPVNKQSGGGNLRQNIRERMISKLEGVVEAKAPYSIFVHEGTPPSPGRFIPGLGGDGRGRRLVNGPNIGMHPGQRPNPFFARAIQASQGKVNEFFQTAIANILKTFPK